MAAVTTRPVSKGKVAFVPPRYGPEAVGGSEAVLREMALGLAGRGWEVEILTTCAVSHFTWENVLPPGESREQGVLIRRFPTVRSGSHAGARAERRMREGQVVPFDEQVAWLSWRFRVPDLFHHLVVHGQEFDAVVLSPYLLWTTVAGLAAVPERAVTVPCLHDEAYARLEVLQPVVADAAMVWFLSEPEHELAHRLGPVAPRHAVVGAGVDVPDHYDPVGFRRRHGLTRPFILYAGRREGGKGWQWLVERYSEVLNIADLDIDLVSIGTGAPTAPPALAGRVIDLGYLHPTERNDAFAAATAYVQPSRMESFSRTIMEAWLAGTPVLARADSDVVAWHCHRSKGGLLFADSCQLVEAIRRLTASPAEAAELAQRGREYVLTNYTWDVVLDSVERHLEEPL